MRRVYLVTRDLHLYGGLFLSPFILVFAISVFYLVHGLAPRPAPGAFDPVRTTTNVSVPPDIVRLQGRARVEALRPVLEQLGVAGEIDFIRHVAAEHRLVIPVRLPDRDTVVSLDYERRTATIASRRQSFGEALVYLHKMPGPHNVDVRGNTALMRTWRVLADVTAYLLLFVTLSGVYLWVALKASDVFLVWNRRVHYYLGLYLLFFCWLFAFTGLLLNHPRWEFAQFWPNRVQTTTEHVIQAPQGTTDLERARELTRQLGIVGEIHWPGATSASGPFAFQVSRPGRIVEVNADLQSGRATLQRTDVNAWGVVHVLHTFIGVRANDTRNTRDWTLTTVWALSMDAVAAGLIVMVFSSYIIWFPMKRARRGGIVALLAGLVSCSLFLTGLNRLM
jgi:hypothetical protein